MTKGVLEEVNTGGNSGSRASTEPEDGLGPPGFDPGRKYGKYGLLIVDEQALETLAQAIACQGAGNIPIPEQQSRLRHALAAFMIRCQMGGEWEMKDGMAAD